MPKHTQNTASDPYQMRLESLIERGFTIDQALKEIKDEEYELFYQDSLENNNTIN